MVLLNALKSSAQVHNVCTEEERCVAANWSTLTHMHHMGTSHTHPPTHIHMHAHTHTDAHTDTHTLTHTPHTLSHTDTHTISQSTHLD